MFGRKRKEVSDIFQKLHHQKLRYFSVRDIKTYQETILGRDGIINIADGDMVIVCQNKEIFRKPTSHLRVCELLSHDGFTIDDLTDPSEGTIMAYYTK